MTVAGLRTRLHFLQRGGVPVPLPRSRVPPGGYRAEATSGSSRAGLTVTVRNSPPKTARAPPVTGTSLPMELPRERAGPSHGGGGTACILWRSPPTIGCRSLHRRVSQTNPEMMVQYRCHPPGGQRCRIRIRKWWLCLPGPLRVLGSSGGLHRVPNPQGWTIGFSGWPALVLRAPPRCLSSRKCMSQLARHLLLWSRKHLRSLRAIHIPGLLNRTADELSRAALPGEWRLHPQTVQLIWRRFGLAQVDLFASLETSHCQLFYSLTEGTLGTDALAHSWPRGLRKYAFPPVSLLAQTLCKVREEEEQVLLVAPYWPTRTWFPELMLLVTAPPWQIPLRKDLLTQRRGTLWHPRPDLWKLHVWSLDDLPQEVVDTITSARAPSTRHAYALKWNLFVEWCSSHREDPRRCPIRVVLSFLQQGLERRLSPSALKVYVAAIAANHDPVEGKSVGKHDWVVRFLRGARRLNPPRPPSIPSWDLSLVLRALQQGPFEPLQTVEPKFLSMKTLLLLALASIKRVGDLHAFSVDDSCLQFGPAARLCAQGSHYSI